jgi:imidazolonepropionase-like amidohydrolase
MHRIAKAAWTGASAFLGLISTGAATTAVETLHALKGITVIDVRSGAIAPDQIVVWDRTRILEAGPVAATAIPAGATVHDGTGLFVMPGLWDMHVHLSPRHRSDAVALPMLVAHGVTAVRDMGDETIVDDPSYSAIPVKRAWDAEARAYRRVGPRIMAFGSVSIDGPRAGSPLPRFFDAATPEQAKSVVQFLVDERSADFIKMYNRFPRDSYFALMAEARRQKIPVAGHKPMSVSFVEAADAGQRSIEHSREILLDSFAGAEEARRHPSAAGPSAEYLRTVLSDHDPSLLRENLAAMVRNGTYYCPTHLTREFDARAFDPAYVSDPRLQYVPASLKTRWLNDVTLTRAKTADEANRRSFADFMVKGLAVTAQAHALGVNLLVGTDSGDSFVFHGSAVHDEMALMVRAGLSPLEVLRCATINPPRYFNRSDDFGAVAKGKIADLLILGSNPLQNIGNTRNIAAVVANGRWFGPRELDDLKKAVAVAAALE